ncbi:MAG TPA: hypothetical protein VN887_03605 [Candidatus Angelobacter sp.]|nr:hypothetical protein [Candidatus Angelobacter sp.]
MKTAILPLVLVVWQCGVFAGDRPSENFTAHEWGTFTSVQGADGILVPWHPLETTQLPRFVYDWTKPGLGRRAAGPLNPGSKSAFITLQRMETPVIYFYSDRERTVNVTVRFPQGFITEWYPQAGEIGPAVFPPGRLAVALDGLVQKTGARPQFTFASVFGRKGVPDSRIQWKDIRVLPADRHADLVSAVPTGGSGNHYFAARETDADFVSVSTPDKSVPEHEKFLFYRGVANFQTPLKVTLGGANEKWFQLRNNGATKLQHLFILNVRNGEGEFTELESLAPGDSWSFDFDGQSKRAPLGEVVGQLGRQIKKALVGEGLFEREAAAMVKTWRESWFEEEGSRVIYLLPRAWTDETLPLAINPEPRDIVRVMIGRAEIIAPTTEWQLIKQIVRYADGDTVARGEAVDRVRQMGLGRFFQPAVQLALGNRPNREFSQAAWELVNAAATKRDDAKPVALR